MDILQFKTKRMKPVPLALAALMGSASTANWAQEKALESIVVTAQRRVEGLQDVPMSVKAFSAKQIRDAGITSTQEFIDRTPNMSFDNSFTYRNSFVVTRGVTQINNADSPVAVVVDGVPQNNQKQLKMNLFDIERIEVLRGPQGALYGRNAIGGVVSIETKEPKGKPEQFAGAEYGSGDARELSAGVSGAMEDGKALYRLVGQSRKSGGQINNTYLNQNVDAIHHDNALRGRLALHGQRTLFDFRASLNDFSAGANWDSIVRSNNPNDIVSPASNMLGKTTGNTREFSVKAEIETDLATVTAITGHTDLTEQYRGDLDFSHPGDPGNGFLGPLPFQLGQGQNLRTKMFSQELRLTSPADQPLRWIAGGYYLNTRRDLETRAFVDTNSQLSQWDDLAKNVVRLAEANDNDAYAVFGQLDVDITAKTTLSGALRHDRDERKQVNVLNGTRRDNSFDAWQPKLTLTQRIDKSSLAYAPIAQGFVPADSMHPLCPTSNRKT
jgi:iron complex outermembrane recepter protein